MTGKLLEQLLITNALMILTAVFTMYLLATGDGHERLMRLAFNVLCVTPYIFVTIMLMLVWN